MFYHSHGLGIHSEMYFPEFIEKKVDVDVTIKFGKVDSSSKLNFRECYLRDSIKIRFISCRIHLFWHDIEVCSIRDGKEIIVNPHTGLEENFLRLLIFGNAMAILLHQRGRLVLHASAVNINGSAVGFLGHSGSGKSTTSLALNKKGYNLVSDDALSVKINENSLPTIFPSFPRIKLWPEVIRNIPEELESIPKSHFNTDKRSYCVHDNFSDTPLPLKTIYLIEESNGTTIKELNPQKSLMELIKSSYCYPMFDNVEISENLKQCSEIVNTVPVKSLKVKRSFEDLPKLVEVIENDVLNINSV